MCPQQRISENDGGLQGILEAIVNEQSVMPQVNGVVIELRDGDQLGGSLRLDETYTQGAAFDIALPLG